MKQSDQLISFHILKIGIAVILVWFTVVNASIIIGLLITLYYQLKLDRVTSFEITPSWFPFLPVPGMFLLFWLYRKVSKQYKAEAEKIDVMNNG